MELVSVGLYGGHLASYSVKSSDGVHFIATLIRFKGNSSRQPPAEVDLLRKGRNWWSNADKELMAFLVHDIASQLKKAGNYKKETHKSPPPINFASFAGGMNEITYKSL